jgi:3-phenylpropionate/cinnamic acid dioxygenase small subunit
MSAGAADRLEAELDIRNLVVRLAQLADQGGVEEYLSLLDPDIAWVMPANPAVGLAASERRGHDEIVQGIKERTAAGVQGPGTDTMHTVTNVWVHLDGPDTATAESSFVFWTTASTNPTATSLGRYRDTLRRSPDGWKLRRRVITFG